MNPTVLPLRPGPAFAGLAVLFASFAGPLPASVPRPASPGGPEALYRPPILGAVRARPFRNDRGELVVPGVRWVVLDPGGWDETALDRAALVPARGHAVGAVRPSEPVPDGFTATRWRAWEEEAQAAEEGAASRPERRPVWIEGWGWVLVPAHLLERVDR